MRPDRRKFLTRGGAVAAAGALLGGCDQLAFNEQALNVLEKAEALTRQAQRLIVGDALAAEYSEAEISPNFKANGTIDPQDEDYLAVAKDKFANYRLSVSGLVERPGAFSLTDLRAMPARTQITRHDCVEGWSCIGKWTGVPLRELLGRAGIKPEARYVVFRCFDDLETGYHKAKSEDDSETSDDDSDDTEDTKAEADKTNEDEKASPATAANDDIGTRYYESLELRDALHPQTILAYEMNGQTLPIPYGAPLRLRVERMLGYKMAKYLRSIEVVAEFPRLGRGKGGYWEDRGYEWFAGI